MQHEKFMDQRKQMVQDMIAFLRSKELTYAEANIILKDAQLLLERASSKNLV